MRQVFIYYNFSSIYLFVEFDVQLIGEEIDQLLEFLFGLGKFEFLDFYDLNAVFWEYELANLEVGFVVEKSGLCDIPGVSGVTSDYLHYLEQMVDRVLPCLKRSIHIFVY